MITCAEATAASKAAKSVDDHIVLDLVGQLMLLGPTKFQKFEEQDMQRTKSEWQPSRQTSGLMRGGPGMLLIDSMGSAEPVQPPSGRGKLCDFCRQPMRGEEWTSEAAG